VSTDSRRNVARGDLEADLEVEEPRDINTVSVVFTDGDVQEFSLVVRSESSEWVYAERCVGVEEEFVEETVSSVRASAIRQIESDRIHLFDDGVLHCGDSYLVDPTSVLESGWFDDEGVL